MVPIMLVDNERIYQKAFRILTERADRCHLAAIAESSSEALKLVKKVHPQIVFVDIHVGEDNGIHIAGQIAAQHEKCDVYILTESGDFRCLHQAMQSGVRDYLFKPITSAKITELVRDTESRDGAVVCQEQADLIEMIELHDYEKAYHLVHDVTDYYYRTFEGQERVEQLIQLKNTLIRLIPGVSQKQKDNYQKKYEITNAISRKQIQCLCWLSDLVTEIFRKCCTFKYVQMSKVFQYIEKNKNQDISLSDLSEEAGISCGYLSRIFKKYFKISVVDFIHLRKIQMAKYYMVSSEMNISDISYMLGYSEAGYFCKIFKKYEGMTPSAYNKQAG